MLKRAKIDNYLKRDIPNPCEYVVIPKTITKEGNAYSIEEVKLMMERAKAMGNINMQLLIALSCRRAETLGTVRRCHASWIGIWQILEGAK